MLESRHRKMPAFSMSLPDERRDRAAGRDARRAPADRRRRRRCRASSAPARRRWRGPSCAPRRAIRALIVPSPTFTLVEVYETPRGSFWHFDLYRLETPEQVFELGWEEALAEGIVAHRMAGAAGPRSCPSISVSRWKWTAMDGARSSTSDRGGCAPTSSHRAGWGDAERAPAGGRCLVPEILIG